MTLLRSLVFSFLLLAVSTALPAQPADRVAAPPLEQEKDAATIEALLREAYGNSPALKAAHARWSAARQQIPQAAALPDPVVSYGYFVERMDTRQIFRVEQMFPGWGRRQANIAVAEEGARAVADLLEIRAAEVRLELYEALADWFYARRSAQLLEENLGLVRQLSEVALQRLRAGDGSQANVLALQMEVEQLTVEIESWKARRASIQAAINAIRGREADAAVPELAHLPGSIAPHRILEIEVEPILQTLELRQSETLIRRAERNRDRARASSRPDIMLGIEYMDNRYMTKDEVQAMVSVSLPLWRGRYRAARREAAMELRAAEEDYAARFNQIQAEARRALFEAQDTARRIRLYEAALIPKAEQSVNTIESDYRTGRSGFVDLLEAQRILLDLKLSLARARSDFFIHLAQWERITGVSHEEAINELTSSISHE